MERFLGAGSRKAASQRWTLRDCSMGAVVISGIDEKGKSVLERDYLMRMMSQFLQAMIKSWENARRIQDPLMSAEMLEAAIGDATDIDGATLLSLAPESITAIMQVSGVDPRVAPYISSALILEASYLDQAGLPEKAELRRLQGEAIARGYGFEMPTLVDVIAELEAASNSADRANGVEGRLQAR